jgi:hypothetical protein
MGFALAALRLQLAKTNGRSLLRYCKALGVFTDNNNPSANALLGDNLQLADRAVG